jgi:hypothetical protein
MTMSKFRIGHPAYKSENHMAYANSKADAVRELRSRGCKRDDARAAVKRAASGSHTGCYGGLNGYSAIEIVACQ